MGSVLPPSPPARQRWKRGASNTRSGDTAQKGQLEKFLRERLENWDKEAAEVVVVWGRVGGMCSPEYHSQLRKALTTLSETHNKEQRRESSQIQTHLNSKISGHRLADDFWTRTQEKLDAAQQHRDRQLQCQQRREANGQTTAPRSPTHQLRSPSCSDQLCILGVRSTPVSSRLTSVGGPHVLLTPAPPTTPPCSSRHAGGGGAAQLGAQRALRLELEVSNAEGSEKRTELRLPLNERSDCTQSGTGSDDSISVILSAADDHEVSAASSTPTATPSQPGSCVSSTFIVRRRRRVHGRLTSSSIVALQYTTRSSRAISGTPSPVAPSPPQRTHRTSFHRSSITNSDAAPKGPTDAEAYAASSLFSMDASLPFPSRAVTAIFASRSSSCEKLSGSGRRRSTGERRVDSSMHMGRERSRREGNAEAQESATSASLQILAPIDKGLRADELSSTSSAASYLNRSDGEPP
ncbi:hypothetical protein LSCM1_00688 [Leishmania martiniquensis]|uniref:Uncharacterized protein n=1 Tax=Leishmania martiniquensis TaxID=1580590 RepID=A0A836KGB9_9TRYP|nr:hypothetical protein LSCM1_00688 [Leishmania martiniquensis]